MGIVIAEMSSWAASTWIIGRKNAFEAKHMKSEYFGDLRVIEKMHVKRNTAHNNKELIKIGFGATAVTG